MGSSAYALCGVLFLTCTPLALATPLTPPQSAPRDAVQDRGTGQQSRGSSLSGRVVAVDTGKPMQGAIVHIVDLRGANPTERQGRWVTTDAEGRWEARDLAAGRYTLRVSKSGYLTIEYGQRRPFERGKTLELSAGQSLEKLDVTLPRGGAITGRIFDEFGDPMTAVMVRAMRHRYVDGERRLIPLAEGLEVLVNGGGDITDDLGQFRVYGLTPGDYYISAVFAPPGMSADRTGYPPIYYPGTASPSEARRVSVGLGEEAQNIDFNLMTARYAAVSGTVINSAGAPVKPSVNLTASEPVADALIGPGVATADGTFTISNVPPGQYNLRVWGVQGPAGVPEFASAPVAVAGQDVTGLVLVTTPGATATGRVVFEGAAPPGTRLFVRAVTTIAAAPTFSNVSVGVRPDQTFEISGLTDRQTFRMGMLPEGWFLKSVIHDGIDVTDSGHEFKAGQHISGVEIRLTQRATTLMGTVQDARGAALPDYTVVAFAADPAKWGFQTRFVRSARPDQEGRFSIRALPPDDYLVVALEYVETGQELDPEQLEKWKTLGTKVMLAEGETKTLLLKLTR